VIWGLDVSHWQTKPAAVPWKGRAFGCVRITWGVEGVDELADEHMARALDAGVQLLIAYHYQKDQPGSIQADHFHRRRRELEATFGPLGCANDLEDMIGPDGKPVPWDLARYQASTAAFVGRHREVTPRPLAIYGNPHDLARYAVAAHIEREPLWLADWQAPYPVPPPWKRWTILQFKGGGKTASTRTASTARSRTCARASSPTPSTPSPTTPSGRSPPLSVPRRAGARPSRPSCRGTKDR